MRYKVKSQEGEGVEECRDKEVHTNANKLIVHYKKTLIF